MADSQIRQTAYKVWISDLINGEYIKPEGEWTPSYVQVRDNKVSRANIVANVIMNYKNEDSTYISLTLDDGSDNIALKAWNEDIKILDDIKIGDTILTIARVREYNGSMYLVPEIIRKLNKPEWIQLRKLELTKLHDVKRKSEDILDSQPTGAGENIEQNKEPLIEEEEISMDEGSIGADRQKILDVIAELDSGDGAEQIEIISKTDFGEENTNNIIQDLLKEGEIFEIKAGRLKLIE
jgi:RPA family protein